MKERNGGDSVKKILANMGKWAYTDSVGRGKRLEGGGSRPDGMAYTDAGKISVNLDNLTWSLFGE